MIAAINQNSFEKTDERWQKLNKKDLLSTNLATKNGYCTQLIYNRIFLLYVINN